VLQNLRARRGRRLMRWLGRWGWLEQVLNSLLPEAVTESVKMIEEDSRDATVKPSITLKRVAVDLTPVLPGGENGGARLLAILLVRYLAQIAPDCEWILLTSDKNHNELADLDSHNVRRLCVTRQKEASGAQAPSPTPLKAWLRDRLAAMLPPSAMARLKSVYRKIFHRPHSSSLPRRIAADLVFCPFTAPFFFDPTVPMVIVVYDLQFLFYPQFFSADERYYRDKHFRESCHLARRLICISDYVRKTVLENTDVSPERVVTAHIRLFDRLPTPSESSTATLERLKVEVNHYLLYPANFWLHKNHEMLLTAFGLFRALHAESDLKLVCTGAPGERMKRLRDVAGRMGLDGWVVFAGYVPDEELAALLQGCHAVIFPSLYEGFGMPVLEAMAFGKPLLCSNVASLPEIAGDAAFFFDPRKPREITSAIERIESDPELVVQLVQRGYQRLAVFSDPAEMARQYFRVFCDAWADRSHFPLGIHGVHPDGWTDEHVTITYDACTEKRYLEISLATPSWLPFDRVSVRLLLNGVDRCDSYSISRSQSLTIRQKLPHQGGFFELLVAPTFQPQAYGMSDDVRALGCICRACRITSSAQIIELLSRESTSS